MTYGTPKVNNKRRPYKINDVITPTIISAMPHQIILLALHLSVIALYGCQNSAPSVSAPQVGVTNTPSAPSTATTVTPTPTATEEPCINDAVFIADLTIPDFSTVVPSEPLRKSWQIRNTGNCSWGPGYHVVFKEGHAMTQHLQHALYPARPETNAVVQINMIAPDTPGDYHGFWRLYDPDGNVFGHKLFIKITVASTSETPNAP